HGVAHPRARIWSKEQTARPPDTPTQFAHQLRNSVGNHSYRMKTKSKLNLFLTAAIVAIATLNLASCSSGPHATVGTATGAIGGTVAGGPVGGAAGAVAGNVAGRQQDRAMGR